MKVKVIQYDIAWGQPAANLVRLDALLAGDDAHADVYVLPEMFTTGFVMQPEGVAETEQGPALQWLLQKACSLDAAIAGSIAVQTADGYYRNRFCFVEPDGRITVYDKRHLFTYGGEQKRYTSGQHRTIVTFRGVRILLQVCYDLRFPVWSRNRSDYDMALYVANWPETRHDVWQTLLRARAIENQCYVVGVNRVGSDSACRYRGGSMIVNPYGQTIASCDDYKESSAVAELDMEHLMAFRRKFPVLQDADDFTL